MSLKKGLQILLVLVALGSFNVLRAQCAFGIKANKTQICEKEVVTFDIDKLPAKIKRINWDFGFKPVDNDTTPSIIYTNFGSYDVELKITFTDNSSCTVTEKDFIEVSPQPFIGTVTPSEKEACGPGDEIKFTNSSSNAVKWKWIIEGKSYTKSINHITHEFSYTGHPIVQLTVESKEGCKNSRIFDSLVHVLPKPDVDISQNQLLLCELPGTLDVKPKYDFKKVDIARYQWEFEGANSPYSFKKDPEKKYYNSAGFFDVMLEMKSKSGCTFKYKFPNAVSVVNMGNVKLEHRPLTADGCNTMRHVVLVKGLKDTSGINWDIDPKANATVDSSRIDSIIITFGKEGTFDVTAIMRFPPCVKKLKQSIKAKDGGINANFNMPDCLCKVPDTILAKNRSTGIGNIKHEWTVTKGKKFSYTTKDKDLELPINKYGKYHVTLKSFDNKGCYSQAEKTIKVRPNKIDTRKIQRIACLSDEFVIPIDSICNFNPDLLKWTFINSKNQVVAEKTGNVITVQFPDTGWYSLALSLRTKGGCFDSLFLNKYILVRNCLADLTGSFRPDSICVGKAQVLFESSFAAQVNITGYFINSQDTTIRYRSSYDAPWVKVTIKKPGIYNFKGTVSLKNGSQSKDVYVRGILKVNQLKVTGKVGKTTGCLPAKKTPLRVLKVENIQYWGTDTTVSFEWSVFPAKKGSLSLKNGRNTVVTTKENGQVDIELKAVTTANGGGCQAVWQSINEVNENIEAKFSLPPNICYGDTFTMRNKSTGKVMRYRWKSSNSNDAFLPAASIRNPKLQPYGEGKRYISLTVWDKDSCSSTLNKSIDLVDLELDFTVADTTPKCSPATFDFKVSGKNCKEYLWDFGDGDVIKTKQRSISKIYDLRRVKPYRNVFSVQVTGSHASGCQQLILKEEIIKIRGPYPDFDISNKMGCSPHTVNFVDKSINVDQLFFDYGDRTSVSQGIGATHVYEADTSKEYEIFRPFVVATDKFDCRSAFFLDDSIIIYTPPDARFGAKPKRGCEPLGVVMNDRSRFARDWDWEIPEANFTDYGPFSNTTLMAGEYSGKLTVTNAIGCKDELLKPRLFKVYPKPEARFLPEDSIGCTNRVVTVYDYSQSDVAVTQYQWFALWDGGADSSTQKDFRVLLDSAAIVDLRLEIENANGCRDTLEMDKALRIYEKLPVAPPAFSYVSHNNNSEVEIHWETPNPSYFSALDLYYLPDTSMPLFTAGRVKQNSYLQKDPTLDTASNCYLLKLTDRCKDIHPGERHCSVHLDVDKSVETASHLSWNHYEGWDSITSYRIYRSELNGKYIHLAQVPGWQNEYIDSGFCDSTYRYLVKAVSNKRTITSRSNSVEHDPIYTYQDVPLEVAVTTVEDNKHVLTLWERSKQLGPVKYQIGRKEQFSGEKRVWKTLKDTFILDKKTDVQRYQYTYRVRVLDQCGNRSPKSNIGRSIVLRVMQNNKKVELNWNPYKKWEKGVSHYIVEVKPPGFTEFTELGETSDTTFFDKDAYLEYELPYTYRVKAIENGFRPDTSYSNERIVIPVPSIFAPNAFSPNNDGVNDSFYLQGWALLEDTARIEEFTLKIFNRWGERVFEAHDLSDGWDGTFKGEDAQLDHYVWIAMATALNGKVYFLRGGVTLIR